MPSISEAIKNNQARIAAGGVTGVSNIKTQDQSPDAPGIDGAVDLPRRGAYAPSMSGVDDFEKTTGLYYGRMRARVLSNPGGDLPQNASIIGLSKTTTASAIKQIITSTGLNFRGTWNSMTTYNVGDVVVDNLSTYVAIAKSLNQEPDKGFSSNWTLLGKNLNFRGVWASSASPGWGPFSASQLNNTGIGNAGAIGPITTVGSGQIGLLVSCQGTDNVPASWTKIFADGFSDGAYVRTFPSQTTVNDTLTASRAAQLLLFNGQWSLPLSLSITSVTIASGVATCQCVNNFIVGTQVLINGLTAGGDAGLNGSIFTIIAADSASFKFSTVLSNTGPNVETGTATNLPYVQASGLVTGSLGQPSFTFTNPVKAGNLLVVVVTSNDTNYAPNINGISSNQGDSFVTLNSNGFTTGVAFSAGIAYVQSAVGGNTTINVTVNSPSSATKVAFFEMPGPVITNANYNPFDYVEFQGSMWVCVQATSTAPSLESSSWQLLAQGAGFVNSRASNYTAVVDDQGRLVTFNSTGAVTLTLPSPPPNSGWWIAVQNTGVGVLTISRNGMLIDGLTSNILLLKTQGLLVFTDGANYFTLRITDAGGVNSQTVNYTALASDNGSLISMNGSNLTLTLPATPPSPLWWVSIENVNATALTVSRNGLLIDGQSVNLTLTQNQGVVIFTDGSNYFTLRGLGITSINGENGAVTITSPGSIVVSTPTSSTISLDLFNRSIAVDATVMSDDYWISVDSGAYDQALPLSVS